MAATETGAGEVLAHLREHGPATRRGLVDGLGWARMTVGKRLDELLAAGFVVSRGLGASEGGRPAETFAVDDDLDDATPPGRGDEHGVEDDSGTLQGAVQQLLQCGVVSHRSSSL